MVQFSPHAIDGDFEFYVVSQARQDPLGLALLLVPGA